MSRPSASVPLASGLLSSSGMNCGRRASDRRRFLLRLVRMVYSQLLTSPPRNSRSERNARTSVSCTRSSATSASRVSARAYRRSAGIMASTLSRNAVIAARSWFGPGGGHYWLLQSLIQLTPAPGGYSGGWGCEVVTRTRVRIGAVPAAEAGVPPDRWGGFEVLSRRRKLLRMSDAEHWLKVDWKPDGAKFRSDAGQ